MHELDDIIEQVITLLKPNFMQGIILLSAVIAYESVSRYRLREEARAAAAALAQDKLVP